MFYTFCGKYRKHGDHFIMDNSNKNTPSKCTETCERIANALKIIPAFVKKQFEPICYGVIEQFCDFDNRLAKLEAAQSGQVVNMVENSLGSTKK